MANTLTSIIVQVTLSTTVRKPLIAPNIRTDADYTRPHIAELAPFEYPQR